MPVDGWHDLRSAYVLTSVLDLQLNNNSTGGWLVRGTLLCREAKGYWESIMKLISLGVGTITDIIVARAESWLVAPFVVERT